MNSITRFLAGTLCFAGALAWASPLCARTLWLEGVSKSSGWFDSEKSPTDPSDDELCWAASASNAIAYWNERSGIAKLKTKRPLKNSIIFDEFRACFVNSALDARYAYGWYFGGAKINEYLLKPEGKSAAPGKYWEKFVKFKQLDDFSDAIPKYTDGALIVNTYETRNRVENFFAQVKDALKNGQAVTLTIAPPNAGGHVISLWGVDLNAKGEFTRLYITDSDDGKNKLMEVKVEKLTKKTQHGDGKEGSPFEYWNDTALFLKGYQFGDNYRLVNYTILTLPYASVPDKKKSQ